MRAYIVVDLGFGYSGKGLLTDFLVRHLEAKVVVRYNGGAQAGHNVITPDGRHHTFSQFGSGAFIPNVKTYLSRHVVIHPGALLIEGDLLEKKGVSDPFSHLRLSDQALVITPFHQSTNRIREIIRGAHRHGSCGVGVGEAVEDSLVHPELRVLAGDLHNPTLLRKKLRAIREQKREQIDPLIRNNIFSDSLAKEYEVFRKEDLVDLWISSIARICELGLIAPDTTLERWLGEAEHVVFEGAQGVLLDGDAGFHPYTTWSNCTAANAFELIRKMKPDAHVLQIGVLRAYTVRHGPGPFPTENDALAAVISEHNKSNEWQGSVRYGWFDAVLARYALNITGTMDALMVTHMDVLSRLRTWKFCTGYIEFPDLSDLSFDASFFHNMLAELRLPNFRTLEERAQVTQLLSSVRPVLEDCEPEDETVIKKIESLVGQRIGLVSHGPTAKNVQILSTL